jgi:hypothetical protein
VSTIKGATQLRARLRAIKVSFKPIGKSWASETRDRSRATVSVRTGRGRASIRVKNASMTKASVAALYYIRILDSGAKAHAIAPRKARALAWQANGRTVFSRKVMKPQQRGTGFAKRAALEALRRHPMAETLIRQWNEAAR